MSDFHVLTQANDKKTVNVVFHISVPASGTNDAGISWRNAVVKEQGGADNIVSVLPDITTQEESALKSGELIERLEPVRFSSISITNAQRLQEIRNHFNSLSQEIIAEKQITLDFMGYEGDVS